MPTLGNPREPALHAPATGLGDFEVPLRSALAQLPRYVAGQAPGAGGEPSYKLSSNENPYAPLPGVVAAIAAAAAHVNRYPELGAETLIEALAQRFGVDAQQVTTGTGSVAVLGQILAATCDPGDEVVFAWRSFEAYPILTAVAGARAVQVALDLSGCHDLAAMAAAVTPRTRVVLVCTPNNPTGPSVTHDQLRAFLKAVPTRVLVVIDEAYQEFVRQQPVQLDALALGREYSNVVVLRTFSKAYGLAGARVGYAVSHPVMAQALRQTAIPFGVSSLAQAGALASLEAQTALLERVEQLVAERTRMVEALHDQGWVLPDPTGNFLWFGLGDRSSGFAESCRQAGLVVRRFGNEGVRVSIGEPAANERFLAVARPWAQQFTPP